MNNYYPNFNNNRYNPMLYSYPTPSHSVTTDTKLDENLRELTNEQFTCCLKIYH